MRVAVRSYVQARVSNDHDRRRRPASPAVQARDELDAEQNVPERGLVSREAGCSERRHQGPAAIAARSPPVKARTRSATQSPFGSTEFTLPYRPLSRLSLRPQSTTDCDGRAASNSDRCELRERVLAGALRSPRRVQSTRNAEQCSHGLDRQEILCGWRPCATE